jgi:hypothetical protein
MTTYKEYKSRVIKTDDFRTVVSDARTEYEISPSGNLAEYVRTDIPFNLEREYLDTLIDECRFDEAKRVLENLKLAYTHPQQHNLIEQYEYRLNLVVRMEKTIQERLGEAKKEFNQHTIFIVSIIVGVITIFGTANNAFQINDFSTAKWTFGVISLTLICFITLMFVVNKFTK